MNNEQLTMKTEWVHKKLGDCCERICNGLTYDVEETQGYFVTRIETISDGYIDYNKIGHINDKPNQDYLMVNGDILFSHINSVKHIGKVAYYDDSTELYHGMNLLLLRANNNIDKLFLFYLLSSDKYRRKIRALAKSAVNQASISTTDLGKFEISFPESLTAQRRIAAILSSADKVIAATQKTIAKYKQIKQGMMEELLNEQCTMNNGEWARKKLIELADYYNGMAFKPSDWENDGTKIIRIEQLNNPLGKYDYYKGCFSETNAIHNGDLIFSWSATLKVVIWQWGDGVLNQHLFKVVPASNVDKHFLYYLLDYNMPKLGESSHGSTMKHIKRKELETYTAYIPRKIAEQKRIASILSSIDSKIECEQSILNKYIQVKKGLMKKLLNEKM